MKVFGADPNYNQARVEDLKKRDQAAAAKSAKYESGGAASAESKTSATVAVSGFAKEVSKAGTEVRNTPDIRREKVEAIKEKISKGEYYVSSEKIAGKIIDDIVKQAK
ncbi:MAG: flagellar biosynthesis anti-sigma factor FlgM [Nitrospinae bacterium]|nr:flagellar biosynthesis anti-sigma factor FlgM [Nitrospinota bacterium]